MARKCGGTSEVAVMDVAAVGVTTRARAAALASSGAATASTTGVTKRRRTGAGESESSKLSSYNSTCTQLRSGGRRRNSASPAPAAAAVEDFRCLSTSSEDHAASVSCCSSYGSTGTGKEKDKLRFTDLEEECGEADSSMSRFSRERRENSTPASRVAGEEETERMNSSLVREAEPNPPQRPEDQEEACTSSVQAELDRLFGKIGKPEVKMPSDSEIEEFFFAAEAENLLELERFKNKYNFDFVKGKPLKGRFEWHQVPSPPAGQNVSK